MFGPALRDEKIVRIALDPRVGGRFSFIVRRQGNEIDHIGRYIEIDRPRRLVFTWAVAPDIEDASRVTVEITPQGAGCELTLTHEIQPQWADYVGRVQEGGRRSWGLGEDRVASARVCPAQICSLRAWTPARPATFLSRRKPARPPFSKGLGRRFMRSTAIGVSSCSTRRPRIILALGPK